MVTSGTTLVNCSEIVSSGQNVLDSWTGEKLLPMDLCPRKNFHDSSLVSEIPNLHNDTRVDRVTNDAVIAQIAGVANCN